MITLFSSPKQHLPKDMQHSVYLRNRQKFKIISVLLKTANSATFSPFSDFKESEFFNLELLIMRSMHCMQASFLTKGNNSAISNTVLSIIEKFFCHAQHLVMSPYLILARPSGNLKKWTVSNLTFPWWTFAPINRIAYLRTISSAINLEA